MKCQILIYFNLQHVSIILLLAVPDVPMLKKKKTHKKKLSYKSKLDLQESREKL